MEELWSSVLSSITRFEYLIARKKFLKLMTLLKLEKGEADRFRQTHIKPHEKLIRTMLHKCNEIDEAYKVCLQDHDDWTVGSNVDGITTRYYIDSNGYINLKIEGEMKKLPLFEQLVVIWEVALYHLWVPYCSESKILKSFDNSEFITTMTLHPPFGISRDIVVHAFGANCLTEENSIVLVTKSLSDNEYHNEISKGVEIPPINKGFFSDRVHLHYLYCINTMTSPTSTNFTAVMKLDPKMSVPGSILSWFINQLAGVVLPLLRKQAVYLAEADPYESAYTNQIREASSFYVDFLLPLYRAYVHKQGWSQPTIQCLYEKGIPSTNFDYSTPLIPKEAYELMQQRLKIRLPSSSSRLKNNYSGANSPGARSNSVISADFYSCLDDEEYHLERKFSENRSPSRKRAPSRSKRVIDINDCHSDDEFDEPFLPERSVLQDEDDVNFRKREDSLDSSCDSNSYSSKNCCLKLFCCCYGI